MSEGWSQRAVFWGPALLYFALIFGISAIPDLPAPPGGMSDKTAHFLLYMGLSVVLVRALVKRGWTRPTLTAVLVAILLSAGYAVTDEFHQLFVPGRRCDWRDAMADAGGAAVAAVGLYCWGIIAGLWRTPTSASSATEPLPSSRSIARRRETR